MRSSCLTLLHRTVKPLLLVLVASYGMPTLASAHDSEDHCAAVMTSVAQSGFADTVSVTCENGMATVVSKSYPDHPLMTGIVGTNEQVPVPAREYAAPIPLNPSLGNRPQTRDGALGVAINGVPIFDYTGGGEMTVADLFHHHPHNDTKLTQQLDKCGGHAGRGDDYHYHVRPVCMIEQMENAGHDAIIGWAFDGYPIYADANPDGTAIEAEALDVCNGQADDTFGYRYHTSTGPPYIIQCLMGKVANLHDLPRIPPLKSAAGNRGRPPGIPPRGGVENLQFTQDDSGRRSMDYTYEGQNYYIRYAPTDTPDCYHFQTRTVTDRGGVRSGVFCR